MTDLKTANEQLAQALKALESPEHDADVREAEACRNRLMELDERIGARIKAKLEAHKAIADAWANEEPDSRYYRKPGKPYPPVEDDALEMNQGMKASVEAVTAENIETVWRKEVDKAVVDGLTADAWQAHHQEHTGKYALSGEEVPDRVMVNGVAEMQQAETVTES